MGSYPKYGSSIFPLLITNLYKITFLLFVVTGTLISVSSYTWLGIWIGLEVNLLSIIPLISNTKNLISSESSLKYFITQTMASSIFLLSTLILITIRGYLRSLEINTTPLTIINSSLLTKIGAAPFHYWFPEVIEGITWINGAILLTWQKLAPIVLLIYNINIPRFLRIIITTCIIVSGIIGLNQVRIRKILAYSSINHIGWIIAAIILSQSIWLKYFLIYSLISVNIILIIKFLNIFYLKQLFSSLNNNPPIKFFFILNFFSLGGLPPFLGFLPKWVTTQLIVNNSFYLLALVIITATLLTLFFYIRITFRSLVLRTSELKFLITIPKSIKNNTIFFINTISLLGLIFCTIVFNWL